MVIEKPILPNTKSKGFTLIELMLATSLLMMVLFSGYYAYSLYTQKWQKRVDVFWQGTQHAIAVDTLQKLISSAVPYVVKNDQDKAQIYLLGNGEQLEFVTGSPIFSEQAALVNISVEQRDNTTQLVYREKSLANFVLINTKQTENKEQSFWDVTTVLISSLDGLEFSYYGWLSFEDAVRFTNAENIIEDRNPPEQSWYSIHQQLRVRILPEQIKIVFSKEQQVTELIVTMSPHTIYQLLAAIRKDTD